MNSFTIAQLEEAAKQAGQTLTYFYGSLRRGPIPIITQEMAYHLDPPPWVDEELRAMAVEALAKPAELSELSDWPERLASDLAKAVD